jgi:Zn-dependent protease with chaperone function
MKMSGPSSDWNSLDARPPYSLLHRAATAFVRLQGDRALKEIEARAPKDDEAVRITNVLAGLAAQLSIPSARVFVYDGKPNALATRTGGRTLAISASYLEDLTRSELEAVAAHCLVRLVPPTRLGDPVGYDDDVRAAALTKFPPALASALAKATPQSGRFSPLYLVAEHQSHRPVELRVAALTDL